MKNKINQAACVSMLSYCIVALNCAVVAEQPDAKIAKAITKAGGVAVLDAKDRISGIAITGEPQLDDDGPRPAPLPLSSLTSDGELVTSKAITQLASPDALQLLRVVGPAANDDLLLFAQNCKNLKVFSACGDLLSDASLIGVTKFPDVDHLHLHGKFSDAGLGHILKLCKPSRLQVVGATVRGECFEGFPAIDRVRYLTLTSCPVNDQGVSELSRATNLGTLSISYSNITDEGLRKLQSLPKLGHLIIRRNRIEGRSLAMFPSLQRLWVFDEPLNPDLLEGLQSIRQLRELAVWADGCGDLAAIHASRCDLLRELEVGHANITLTGLESLQNARNLECLRIEDQAITRDMLRAVAALRNTHSVSLRYCDMQRNAISQLLTHGAIRELDLYKSTVSDLDVDSLIALRPMRLDVSETDISEQGLRKLKRELGNALITSSRK